MKLLLCISVLIYLQFVSAKHPFPPKFEQQKWQDLPPGYRADNGVSYRLPNNTKPEAYDISLWTNVHTGNLTFGGEVDILLRAEEDTSNITIHYRDLTILETKLFTFDESPVEIEIENTTYDPETEFYGIFVKNPMVKGQKYALIIRYQGTMRNQTRGVFRQSYVDDAGKTKYLLATHFEPHNARHGFPCYDEPALKAIIRIKITHDQYYTAISNMPGSTAVPIKADGTVTTIFEPTPLMSTYLTAFAVTDYANISRIAEYPELNRAFAQSNRIHQSDIVVDTGIKVLEGIRKYLDVPFSLPKMDQIAVPTFGGAMENWGLVVYGTYWFFYNETVDSYSVKESIYTIIAHEFGHQWFGNLVGPRWWTYIWLNEGFANYFGYKAIDLFEPDMQLMDLYVVDNTHSILGSDASIYTRPMTYYAEDPDGISYLFDNIAYAKSGCVINMFSHAFSERSFTKGLKYYLDQKGYSDAAEEDLFDALEKAVKEDNTLNPRYNVERIMLTWTRQKGYPILHVTVQDDGTIEVLQERYFNDLDQSDNTSLWWIPYNYVTASDTGNILTSTFPDGWINQKKTIIEPDNFRKRQSDDWVVFNKQQTGYYRIKYDERNYKRIGDGLAKDPFKLNHLTKGQLLHDVNNFMVTGRIEGYDIILGLIRFLKYETEYVPWRVAESTLTFLNRKLSGTEFYHLYEEVLRNLIAKFYNSLGADDISGEPHLHKYSRGIALDLACRIGLEACLRDANDKITDFISNGQTFHQNIRNQLYCAGLRSATEEQYEAMWKIMFNDNYNGERGLIFRALSCTKSEVLLEKFARSALKSLDGNSYDYSGNERTDILINVLRSGEKGLKLVMEFATEHLDDIVGEFSSNYVYTIVHEMSAYVTSDKLDADYQKLLDRTGYANNEYIQKILDDNREWNSKYLDSINSWLQQNV